MLKNSKHVAADTCRLSRTAFLFPLVLSRSCVQARPYIKSAKLVFLTAICVIRD